MDGQPDANSYARLTKRGWSRYATPCAVAIVVLGAILVTTSLEAQSAAKPAAGNTKPSAAAPAEFDNSFFGMIKAGGWVGHTIILLSVVAVSIAIEHLLTIRRKTLIPASLPEKVRDLLRAGQYAQADQQCRLQPSTLASVLQAGIGEIDGGWPVVEKAMEDAMGEQAARLHRKAEYISVIGNIAPMLGLLGTVIGMIEAFSVVAESQGTANAGELARGIYLALVTTVEGLVVAIPALAVFAIFRNRIDGLVAETAYVAQHVFAPLRRAAAAGAISPPPTRRPAPPPPPIAGPA
ncbi:MAG: MotA/TolQ/ExbB proton channel family protein [Planctomycetia bacterium]|nr:MotA/TolQ/ExbB proton channel family protein [Planctomycetia bacterium]